MLGMNTPMGLPSIFARMREDLEVAVRQDPAARSRLEVLLAYPGVHAIWLHRAAHALWKRDLVLAPRLLSHLNRFLTGVEIHPGAQIGRRVFIDHGMGVVIGETAEIGDSCVIYKGVVLGGVSQVRVRRHPRLGKRVVVGSNACVLGAVDVGDGARIGSGSVVIRDVPEEATVVGVPGRVVTGRRSHAELAAHADLPDPVADALQRLAHRVEAVETALGREPAPEVDGGEDPFAGAVEGLDDRPAGRKTKAGSRSRGSKSGG
jgi:serine O-acetyltransferase